MVLFSMEAKIGMDYYVRSICYHRMFGMFRPDS